jgi:hypothetical protein
MSYKSGVGRDMPLKLNIRQTAEAVVSNDGSPTTSEVEGQTMPGGYRLRAGRFLRRLGHTAYGIDQIGRPAPAADLTEPLEPLTPVTNINALSEPVRPPTPEGETPDAA